MERCKACSRSLTNEISKKYGYGPDCLKRAVEQGNAPIESLEQLKEMRRIKKPKQPNPTTSDAVRCDKAIDMFEQAKAGALRMLKHCIAECESLGIKINCTIEG